MSTEPNRIGLTDVTVEKIDELLDELNPLAGEDGDKLVRYDLYRLAVALGVKNKTVPVGLTSSVNSFLRVADLDPDKVLYSVVENSGLNSDSIAIYSFIERLAEQGIKEMYNAYDQTGEIPFEEYFLAE
ncbi:hypothetical protein [Shewanella pealeana]|uniref:Uncharacterized protein n=1 Tax=Shewanella pealeana (strain ATCC 700345 / ANG-SQ1) TaxID=398579 RepID=A8H4Z3_SHEPA|nr:hypothetical protein [Shewanella pealeana]ABV87630.1 hypothetical protein Spea_2310 [Shewanella pealeana ATCC 700345]